MIKRFGRWIAKTAKEAAQEAGDAGADALKQSGTAALDSATEAIVDNVTMTDVFQDVAQAAEGIKSFGDRLDRIEANQGELRCMLTEVLNRLPKPRQTKKCNCK